jgi:hypothetical protein
MHDDWYDREFERPRHSSLGIVSLIIGGLVGILEFIAVLIAGILETTHPNEYFDENSPSPMGALIGLGICGGLVLCLVGGALGLAGVLQQRRNKLFAILGLILNAVIVCGVLFLLVLGMLMQ